MGQLNDRKRKKANGFEVLPREIFALKLIFSSTIVGVVAWVMAGYNGISWTAVIVLLVFGVYHFITTGTVLGRNIYAVGGNPEAAELSGMLACKRIW